MTTDGWITLAILGLVLGGTPWFLGTFPKNRWVFHPPAAFWVAGVLLFVLAVTLYGLFALLERRVVDWTPRTAPQGER